MPLLKHARKKLRQDKKRTLKNKKVRELYKELVKKAKINPTKEALSAAFSAVDKAAKEHIIHENKAARLKASLTKGEGESVTAKGIKEEGAKKPSASAAKKKPTTKKAVTKKATKKAGK